MLCRNLFLRSCSTYHLPVRGLESHPFDHDKYSDRNPTIKPDKLRITIPVPVQSRALKRHRNPKTISKELDKEKMRSKKTDNLHKENRIKSQNGSDLWKV